MFWMDFRLGSLEVEPEASIQMHAFAIDWVHALKRKGKNANKWGKQVRKEEKAEQWCGVREYNLIYWHDE